MTEPKHPQCEFDFEQYQEPRRIDAPTYHEWLHRAAREEGLSKSRQPMPEPLRKVLSGEPEDQLRFNEGKPRMHYVLAAPNVHIAMSLLGCFEYSHEDMSLLQAACGFMAGGGPDEFVRDVCEIAENTGKCAAELYQEVAEYGANKYSRGNFLKGANVSQYLDSWLRHFQAKVGGQPGDAESGKLHMSHIVWNTVEAARWIGHATRDDRLVSKK